MMFPGEKLNSGLKMVQFRDEGLLKMKCQAAGGSLKMMMELYEFINKYYKYIVMIKRLFKDYLPPKEILLETPLRLFAKIK